MKLDKFPFHILLQKRSIPALEELALLPPHEFTVRRLGTYIMRLHPTRDHASIRYTDLNQKIWWIEKKDK